MTFHILDIIRGTTVDGPGFRTAIYLAGCPHRCRGCHNPQSHDPEAGTLMTLDQILDIVKEEDFNVTLTGGDPLYNPEASTLLARTIKEAGYSVWLYTGYTYEQILDTPRLRQILPWLEAIVDGPYMKERRNSDLKFRGSDNQRIIFL